MTTSPILSNRVMMNGILRHGSTFKAPKLFAPSLSVMSGHKALTVNRNGGLTGGPSVRMTGPQNKK